MHTYTVGTGCQATYQYGSAAVAGQDAGGFADTLQKTTKKMPTITSSEGLVLHYRKDYVAEDGSTCLTSWTDARTGVNTCIFKPADFDEENPVYRVEVWDKDGNMTEKHVAMNDVDSKHATAAEMYAYSVHLQETGKCPNAVMSMMGAKNRLVDGGLDSDGLTVFDWTKIMRDLVQEQYTVGNREGYLRYKAFYDAMTMGDAADTRHSASAAGTHNISNLAFSTHAFSDESNIDHYNTDKTLSLSDMIRQFEEMHKITAEDLRQSEDWREMTEDQWDKLLEGIDEFIDAQIERLRDMQEAQEMETQANAKITGIANEGGATYSHDDNPIWHWHDGQFGYSAEVFKNNETDSEYTVKLRYDDGREETRIVNADAISASNCNIVDLSVKIYHLESIGAIDNPNPHILLAHLYMRYRTPDANENTSIDFTSWYERQLELEMSHDRNSRHISSLEKMRTYLSDSRSR